MMISMINFNQWNEYGYDIIFYILSISLTSILNDCIQPVMSCAGIDTCPMFAKFCKHDAVSVSEATEM